MITIRPRLPFGFARTTRWLDYRFRWSRVETGDFGKQTIATLLAGVTAAANFESANAANKLQVSSTASVRYYKSSGKRVFGWPLLSMAVLVGSTLFFAW